jgi:hypothetical protein
MSKFDEIYYKIISEDILFEGRNEALVKWGNTQEVDEYLEKFMNKNNGIRLKIGKPFNDIDYWHSKKSFNEFKEFIDAFQSKSQIKNDKKYNLKVTDDGKGKLIDSIKDYEIWFVGSANAAKQLGRFYKGISTKWCICTDNADYYWNNDHKNDTFYFLIRREIKNDEFDKLAFEFKANSEIKIWDLNNRKNTFKDESIISYMKENFKWINKVSDIEKYFLNPVKIKENADGTINVYGSIYLDEMNLSEFPWKDKFKINELFGSLYIQYNNFKNFDWCPKIIHGDFDYSNNPIENFDKIPLVDGFTFNE